VKVSFPSAIAAGSLSVVFMVVATV